MRGKACAVSNTHPHKCRRTVHAINNTWGGMNGVIRQRQHEEIQGCRLNGRFGEPGLLDVCEGVLVRQRLIHSDLPTTAGSPVYEINLLKLNQHLVDICVVISCWLTMLSQHSPTGNHPEHLGDLAMLTDISLCCFPFSSHSPLCPSRCPSADYVYFENSSSNPLLIRRIEELNKVSVCVWGRIRILECSTDLSAVHQNKPTNPLFINLIYHCTIQINFISGHISWLSCVFFFHCTLKPKRNPKFGL